MAFVNEYATDEDVEKYDLKEVWYQYYPYRKSEPYYGRQPKFTIDRKNKRYFMILGQGKEDQSNR